jgi:gamma-glutamyltranspeptidase / glutathione hydrolase
LLLFFFFKTKKVEALNGSGRCAKAMTLEFAQSLANKNGTPGELPPFHAACVTVPGAVAGWCDAVEKWGSKNVSMGDILEPAAQLAEGDSAPIAPVTAYSWDKGVSRLMQSTNAAEMLIRDPAFQGNKDHLRAPHGGEALPRPGLAKVFRLIAKFGKEGFYTGEVAEAIVEEVRSNGGLLSLEDLAEHSTTFPEPISTTYRGVRLHEVPPNGQGIAALIALNLLSEVEAKYPELLLQKEETEEEDSEEQSLARKHAMIECMRLAFADTRGYVGWNTELNGTGDGGGENVKVTNNQSAEGSVSVGSSMNNMVQSLLSKEYAVERSKAFDMKKAIVGADKGVPDQSSCTVSFQVCVRVCFFLCVHVITLVR